MQYHCIVILVNRPFVTPTGRSRVKPSSNSTSSRQACSDAAKSIARLIRIYDRLYTLNRCNVQMVHLIFTTTVIHVYNACTGLPEDRDSAAQDLEVCCDALRTIGQSFKSANRAHEVIIYLKFELLNRRKANAKRPQPASSHLAEETSLKRHRASGESETAAPSQPSLDQSPMNEWAYLNFEPSPLGNPFPADEAELDPLFWANFATVDASDDNSWNHYNS